MINCLCNGKSLVQYHALLIFLIIDKVNSSVVLRKGKKVGKKLKSQQEETIMTSFKSLSELTHPYLYRMAGKFILVDLFLVKFEQNYHSSKIIMNDVDLIWRSEMSGSG